MRAAQFDIRLCKVGLLELRRTLQYEVAFNLPYAHCKRLIEASEKLFEDSARFSEFALAASSVNSETKMADLVLLKPKVA
ncbi:MAG: hypothetical protein JWN18_361 [Parcubacteria group bacterium]|nr:hypothetical protein [Parcubacteria group bacterium]